MVVKENGFYHYSVKVVKHICYIHVGVLTFGNDIINHSHGETKQNKVSQMIHLQEQMHE